MYSIYYLWKTGTDEERGLRLVKWEVWGFKLWMHLLLHLEILEKQNISLLKTKTINKTLLGVLICNHWYTDWEECPFNNNDISRFAR